MTLLASVASIFCSLSVSAAAPAVAVVPVEIVNKVEIISPVVQTDAAADSESLAAIDPGEVSDAADVLNEAADLTPDKLADDSSDEQAQTAEVAKDDVLLLPA